MNTATRIFEFDSAHRVMHEKVKCFNLHGHRWKLEATFEYLDTAKLGYAIDFKEIKRVVGDLIDNQLDHACIANPKDTQLIDMCKSNGWRLWVMGMGSSEDINPSAENLASEIAYILKNCFSMEKQGVSFCKLRLYETPNCWVETDDYFYPATEEYRRSLQTWRKSLGDFNYDEREG